MRTSAHTNILSQLSSSSFPLKLQLLTQRPCSLLSSLYCLKCFFPSRSLSFFFPSVFFTSHSSSCLIGPIVNYWTTHKVLHLKYLCVCSVSEVEHVAKVTRLIGVVVHTHKHTPTGRVTLQEKSTVIFPVQH